MCESTATPFFFTPLKYQTQQTPRFETDVRTPLCHAFNGFTGRPRSVYIPTHASGSELVRAGSTRVPFTHAPTLELSALVHVMLTPFLTAVHAVRDGVELDGWDGVANSRAQRNPMRGNYQSDLS